MGASGWHYVVPYNENPNQALQQLREEVFAKGEYGDPCIKVMSQIFLQLQLRTKIIVSLVMFFLFLVRFFRWVNRGFRKPKTIDEAREIAAESGTHSILDIERCSQTPGFGIAYLLSPARRSQIYGTDKPTKEIFEKVGWSEPTERLDRWQAVYFPLYEEDKPVNLVFVGCSGD